MLRAFGLERARQVLAAHIEMAQRLKDWIEADPDFEVLAPVPFSTVVFRHRAGDEANRSIEEAVNGSGVALISHTSVGGAYVLRMAIGNLRTTEADVRAAWDAVRAAAAQLKVSSQTSSSNPTS